MLNCLGNITQFNIFLLCVEGEDYIILVYDITASGLNDTLWAPTFFMPSIDNVLDVATHLSLFRNIDTAEMFHN